MDGKARIYVTNAASNNAKRTTQRLALTTKPEVKETLEVPKGSFSEAIRVKPAFNMPGGGLERTGQGNSPEVVKKVVNMK